MCAAPYTILDEQASHRQVENQANLALAGYALTLLPNLDCNTKGFIVSRKEKKKLQLFRGSRYSPMCRKICTCHYQTIRSLYINSHIGVQPMNLHIARLPGEMLRFYPLNRLIIIGLNHLHFLLNSWQIRLTLEGPYTI